MNIFRRQSQKQYDGPAIAPSGCGREEPSYVHNHQQRRRSSSDAVKHNRRQSSSGRRSSHKDARRNAALAPGISSRRTSEKVSHHLPAHAMGSAKAGAGSGMPTNAAFAPRRGDRPNATRRRKERKPQVPMEHDGGVLCLCAIPETSQIPAGARQDELGTRTHRFLSGGVDGTVKLWEVHETPEDGDGGKDEKGQRGITPQLVRTYRGHSGYVHSIAVLGSLSDAHGTGDASPLDESRRSCQTASSDSSGGGMLPSSIRRRMGRLAIDGSGSDRRDFLQKQMLFVSASRDNTMRIWAVDDGNDEHEGCLDSCLEAQNGHGNGKKEADPYAKGTKLRGHQFGGNAVGGVLCVCAVPSLFTGNVNDDDSDSKDAEETVSAGQFCSGGSDGCIRVWDVRSALHLRKIPKSGMYGTVQLQCIHQSAAAVTSLVCTHRGVWREGKVALFAGDANGVIRRYSKMNECSSGHINGAVWWRCTGVFDGHCQPITSLVVLSSAALMPMLCPNGDGAAEKGEIGTMLVSSCEDGSIRVWDALDARDQPEDSSEKSGESRGIAKRTALWKIGLHDSQGPGSDCPLSRPDATRSRPSGFAKDSVRATSLATLQIGTLVAAGTTDGTIRLWNLSSGLYEGSYCVGDVHIWSLDTLSEREEVAEERDESGKIANRSAGILISGDDRGRIRVLRK